MVEDMRLVLDEIYKSLGLLQKDYPDKMKPFGQFMQAVEGSGKLDNKTKELISVALSVQSQCTDCIAYHTKLAMNAGANKDEIMEASFVAVLMHGGPAMMKLKNVLKAIEDYEK